MDVEVCEFANENDLPSRNSKFAIVHGAEAANNFVDNVDTSKYDSGIVWLRNGSSQSNKPVTYPLGSFQIDKDCKPIKVLQHQENTILIISDR